jgi:hypothetical protein
MKLNKTLAVIAAILALTICQDLCEPSIYDTPQMIPIKKGTTYSAV